MTGPARPDGAPVVEARTPVTLLGAAPVSPSDLDAALALAPVLVAADGGADGALAAGRVPAAVVGDMDSLSGAAARAFAGRLHPVAEQETTDFDKALSRIQAPLVVALGFSGGRLDHELAALHGLLAHADRPCLLVGGESLAFLCPPEVALPLPAGGLVSLFPLVPVRVESRGLRWPTGGLDFAPDRRIGTSNAATGPETSPVRLGADRPGMLVILPRATLSVAAAALGRAPRWPAARGR
jgi:thiamine pyrophosphokinase